MNKIFKYPIPVLEKFSLNLAKDARILRVDTVEGQFWLWVIVNPDVPTEKRYFECYKTGMPIETDINELKYIGFYTLYIMQELCLYMFERVLQENISVV